MVFKCDEVSLSNLKDLLKVASKKQDQNLENLCNLAIEYLLVVNGKYAPMPNLAQMCAWLRCVELLEELAGKLQTVDGTSVKVGDRVSHIVRYKIGEVLELLPGEGLVRVRWGAKEPLTNEEYSTSLRVIS